MRRLILLVLGLAAALVLMPTTAVADSARLRRRVRGPAPAELLRRQIRDAGHAHDSSRTVVGHPHRDLRHQPEAAEQHHLERRPLRGSHAQPPRHDQLQPHRRRRQRHHPEQLQRGGGSAWLEGPRFRGRSRSRTSGCLAAQTRVHGKPLEPRHAARATAGSRGAHRGRSTANNCSDQGFPRRDCRARRKACGPTASQSTGGTV
jgi:hypothetical protein